MWSSVELDPCEWYGSGGVSSVVSPVRDEVIPSVKIEGLVTCCTGYECRSCNSVAVSGNVLLMLVASVVSVVCADDLLVSACEYAVRVSVWYVGCGVVLMVLTAACEVWLVVCGRLGW